MFFVKFYKHQHCFSWVVSVAQTKMKRQVVRHRFRPWAHHGGVRHVVVLREVVAAVNDSLEIAVSVVGHVLSRVLEVERQEASVDDDSARLFIIVDVRVERVQDEVASLASVVGRDPDFAFEVEEASDFDSFKSIFVFDLFRRHAVGR